MFVRRLRSARARAVKESRASSTAARAADRLPGNPTCRLYVFARFATPLEKFRKYVTDDLEPFYEDEEIAVVGVNTARSLTTKYGRINEEQVAHVRARLCNYADAVTKIVVTHHPFDLPEGHDERQIVGRGGWR